MRTGKAWGALYFPSNYSRFLAARHIWGRYASDKALNQSEISVWMDMSSELRVSSPDLLTKRTQRNTLAIAANPMC